MFFKKKRNTSKAALQMGKNLDEAATNLQIVRDFISQTNNLHNLAHDHKLKEAALSAFDQFIKETKRLRNTIELDSAEADMIYYCCSLIIRRISAANNAGRQGQQYLDTQDCFDGFIRRNFHLKKFCAAFIAILGISTICIAATAGLSLPLMIPMLVVGTLATLAAMSYLTYKYKKLHSFESKFLNLHKSFNQLFIKGKFDTTHRQFPDLHNESLFLGISSGFFGKKNTKIISYRTYQNTIALRA